MLYFAGDSFKDNYRTVLYKRSPDQITMLLNVLWREIDTLREEAFDKIRILFDEFPNRKYEYKWPKAYEWDSELYLECPTISFRTSEISVVRGTFATTIIDAELTSIYIEEGVIMVYTNRGSVPLTDVLEIEVVLDSILSAKDAKKGLSNNGLYFED